MFWCSTLPSAMLCITVSHQEEHQAPPAAAAGQRDGEQESFGQHYWDICWYYIYIYDIYYVLFVYCIYYTYIYIHTLETEWTCERIILLRTCLDSQETQRLNAEPMLGNIFLDQLLGLQQNGERINVLSYLTQSETRALDATCFDVCLWTEIHARKWLQIPMVESDVEKAAWYRLWGHYYWLSWLPWKLGSSLHRSVLGCKQHVAQFYLLGLLDMLPLPRRWPWLALSAPHCRSQVQLPCLRASWDKIEIESAQPSPSEPTLDFNGHAQEEHEGSSCRST